MTPQPDIEYPVVLLWSAPDSDGNTDAAAEARALISMGYDAGIEGALERNTIYPVLRVEIAELPREGDGLDIHGYGMGERAVKPCALAVLVTHKPDGSSLSSWLLWHALENGIPL